MFWYVLILIYHSPVCLCDDLTYSLWVHSQASFRGNLNPLHEEFNSQMSKVRIILEWLFNEIVKYLAFLDFKENLRIGISPVEKK